MLDIQQRLGTWIPQVQGQYINMDWNPQNKGFGAQCWDLAAHWSNFLGLPIINTGNTATKSGRWPGWAGNMVDCFPQTAAIAAAYTLHGPNEVGQPGDICVWGDSNKVWYPATHVAVLVLDKGAWLQAMSLNSTPSRADNPYPEWTSGPTTIQSLPRQGLIGLIRPNVGGLSAQGGTTPIKSEEDDIMTATPEQQDAFIRRLMDYQITQAGGGKVTLGEHIAEARGHIMDVIRVAEGIDDAVLDTLVDGVAGDKITLRQFLSEYRAHIIQLVAGIAAEAALGGASIADIKKAVADGLSAGVDVNVTVGGN